MDFFGSLFDPQDLNGWSILGAVLALVGGWILARLARRGIYALGARFPNITPIVVSVVARIAGYGVWLLAAGIALAFLGADIQPLIIGLLLTAAIVFFALRGLADNFGAGLVIQARRPISIGDEIAFEQTVGVVKELNARSVLVESYDGALIHVPNAELLGNVFANNSLHGARRSTIELRAERTADPADLVAIVTTALPGVEVLRAEPAPSIIFTEISTERIIAQVRVWHAPGDESRAKSSAISAISSALGAAGLAATVQAALAPPPFTPPPTL